MRTFTLYWRVVRTQFAKILTDCLQRKWGRLSVLLLVLAGISLSSQTSFAAPLSGVVYEPTSGRPVSGVELRVFYDESDTQESGGLVPPQRLPAGQQNQKSADDGSYRFDLPEGRIYRIEVSGVGDSVSFPSKEVLPKDGFPRSGEIGNSPSPRSSGERPFYLRFDATSANARWLFNHIAVDKIADATELVFEASRSRIGLGESVGFEATFSNRSQRELSSEEGKAVYFLLSPARGMRMDSGSMGAELHTAENAVRKLSANLASTGKQGDGLYRIGPFEVAAGEKLKLYFQGVAAIAGKNGRYINRIRVMDGAGVALSKEAKVEVRTEADRDFSQSTILGRVFCDANRNGEFDKDERGLFGAKVYSDTGAIARSDRHGRFHFTRIKPGSHSFKIDEGSLLGGEVRGEETRLLRLTEGVPMSLRYPVICRGKWIGSEHGKVRMPLSTDDGKKDEEEKPKTMPLTGRLSPMTVAVDGVRYDLPVAKLIPEFSRSLIAVPGDEDHAPVLRAFGPKGLAVELLRWRSAWGGEKLGTPKSWRFTIQRVEEGGLAPIYERSGKGVPPAFFEWKGISDAGRVAQADNRYVARLTISGHQGAQAASERMLFAVASSHEREEQSVLTGELFQSSPSGLQASPQVDKKLLEIGKSLTPGSRVEIEVHTAGSGARLKEAAQSQKEAEHLARLFEAIGVRPDNILARGRGASEPAAKGAGVAQSQRNRRIVIRVYSKNRPSFAIPKFFPGQNQVRIDGRRIPVSSDGGFESEIPDKEGQSVQVELEAKSGRNLLFFVNPAEEIQLGKSPQNYEMVLEANAGLLKVDINQAPKGIWDSDLQLERAEDRRSEAVSELKIHRASKNEKAMEELRFRATGDSISVAQWSFIVASEGGEVVYRKDGKGKIPDTIVWSREEAGGFSGLKEDELYRYWLDATLSEASGFRTRPRWFHVDPRRKREILMRKGRFVDAKARPTTKLRNLLSRYVSMEGKERAADSLRVAIQLRKGASLAKAEAEIHRYLSRLGGKALSRGIVLSLSEEKVDRVRMYRERRIGTTFEESLKVNGKKRQLGSDGKALVQGKLNSGESLVVEYESKSGRRIRFVGISPSIDIGQTMDGELIPPNPLQVQKSTLVEEGEDGLAEHTAAESLQVYLPPKGSLLGESQLPLQGAVEAGKGIHLSINGEAVSIDESGNFTHVVNLPIGFSILSIVAEDPQGGKVTIPWPLRVSDTHFVATGVAEAALSTSLGDDGFSAEAAQLPGMGADANYQLGPMLLAARAQAYVKGRFPGGKIAPSIEISAQVDTARERTDSALFAQVDAPNLSYPVLGDDAEEIQDVNTRGKVYAHVKAGDSSAAIGSIRTGMQGGGDLFRYERTTNGALVDLHREVGEHEISVRAFRSSAEVQTSRGSDWFRSTGGSLYYLRKDSILEGSERVRVIVRDRDSGLPVSERILRQGKDYNVDYRGGRIRLTEALSSTQSSSWVIGNFDTNSNPMTGQLVYLAVDYEYEDQNGLNQLGQGAYVSADIEGLSLGGGIVDESRDGEENYRLVGADLSYNFGEQSNFRAEVAASRNRDSLHAMSLDGGLRFGRLQSDSAFDEDGQGMRLGWKLSADVALRDWSDAEEFAGTGLSLYLQDMERGFASGDAVLEQGRFKFGARLQHKLNDRDRLAFRHEAQISSLPRVGPTLQDVSSNPEQLRMEEQAAYITSLQWARSSGAWEHRLEASHQRISSSAVLADNLAAVDLRRYGLGSLSEYKLSSRSSLRFGQQFITGSKDADPLFNPVSPMRSSLRNRDHTAGIHSSLGAEFKLAPDLSLSSDYIQRWNGDNAIRAGLKNALDDDASMYLQEEVGQSGGRFSNATIVGAEDRFGDDGGGRSYGEYQLRQGGLGARNRAVLGLGRFWQLNSMLALGAGFEHQQAFGGYLPDGTAIGDAQRNILRTSFRFNRKKLSLGGQVEFRLDNGDDGDGVDPAVLGDDPREGIGEGVFSDHGGTVPGAALIVAPGDERQMLASLGARYVFDESHRALSRLRASQSLRKAPSAQEFSDLAKFTELSVGWAYRPTQSDRFEVLSRYSYLMEQGPQQRSRDYREDSHIFAVVPYARLPYRILASAKLAWKSTRRNFLGEEESAASSVQALLGILRLGYQFYGNWDLSGEARALSLYGTASQRLFGTLWEVGYSIQKRLRVGVGYNLSHFSDNEFDDLTRDGHGFFFRLTGHY